MLEVLGTIPSVRGLFPSDGTPWKADNVETQKIVTFMRGGRSSKTALSCPDEQEMALEEWSREDPWKGSFPHAVGIAHLVEGPGVWGASKARTEAECRARGLFLEGGWHPETERDRTLGQTGAGRSREGCPRAGGQLEETDSGLEFWERLRRMYPKKPGALGALGEP